MIHDLKHLVDEFDYLAVDVRDLRRTNLERRITKCANVISHMQQANWVFSSDTYARGGST